MLRRGRRIKKEPVETPKKELPISILLDARKHEMSGGTIYKEALLPLADYFFQRNWGESGKKAFRTLFHSIPEIPKSDTWIGIEIEVENVDKNIGHFGTDVWKIKGDGSLRNGYEFVSPAIHPNEAPVFLGGVYYILNRCMNCRPDFSWRTSTHVHIDCQKLSINEFKRLLLLYCIFEEALFQFANPGRRETNIFCTPLTRSNLYVLSEFIHAPSGDPRAIKHAFTALNSVIKKYSALNLGHIYDFGTVEFRHMRGTNDLTFLVNWLKLILHLYQTAQDISKEELMEALKTLNTTSAYTLFAERVFGEEAELLQAPIDFQMARGVSLTKEVVFGDVNVPKKAAPEGGIVAYIEGMKHRREDKLQRKALMKGTK